MRTTQLPYQAWDADSPDLTPADRTALMWLALAQLGKVACPPGIVCPCIPCACCWRCYFEEKARRRRVESPTKAVGGSGQGLHGVHGS